MKKARELTLGLLLALGALLIGGILLEQLHRDHLYLDLHATSLKTVLFAILAVVFLAAAVFCAGWYIYQKQTSRLKRKNVCGNSDARFRHYLNRRRITAV